MNTSSYIGRLAPTPSGGLHLGHAQTFRSAWKRAREAGGHLLLRVEDLDAQRCKPEYVEEMLADLRWLGLDWDGEPIFQSQRREHYLAVWQRLKEGGFVYPCRRSRRELRDMVRAPHEDEESNGPLFPVEWRVPPGEEKAFDHPAGVTWRFRVRDGERVTFVDARHGGVGFVAGVDFGDFGVWRSDDVPAYELAVVADDIAQGVTEVVRGEDLLLSTARQILLYRALGATPPAWCHEPLVRDAQGKRLSKRDPGLTIRELRMPQIPPELA
jgi:glutamyl-tRNA synthetase